jgi:hypothetical protein
VPDRPDPIPLAAALSSVVSAAVAGDDRIGLLAAVVDRPATMPHMQGPTAIRFPRPSRPLDDGPQAA